MFDVTDRESFEKLPVFVQIIRDDVSLEDPVVILLGNKIDLVHKPREVPATDAVALCNKHNFKEYIETSAKDGTGKQTIVLHLKNLPITIFNAAPQRILNENFIVKTDSMVIYAVLRNLSYFCNSKI